MIYLVRHGQSEWNLLRRTQGQIRHPALTELGRRQAAAAARAIRADGELSGRPAGSVVSSDLARAVQTASIVAAALGASLKVDRRWREQGLGRFEGLGYETTSAGLAAGPVGPDVPIGGGESAHQVTDRVTAALSDLDPAQVTVVVTHGDTIRCLLAHVIGAAVDRALADPVPNGTVIALDAGPGCAIRRLDGPPLAGV
ncbi:MAG TPA: histidine phosphatase family protein [Acidimicrobiales bacterium]|nr:histidine phosphatase family protein [Acidimicrobiales bacterium]